MKPINLEVEEGVQTGTIDKNGDFNFKVYTSNQCDGDLEEAMETMCHLWHLDTDVSLTINIRLKEVYEDLFESYNCNGEVMQDDAPLFEALLKDCQWIINQINSLKMKL